ncbi:peptidoglycan recognition protein 1-like [Ptychodera flava]|uniref:peptidoglycan recognition protein 1-like n=1 Tax=Ptychodera flava TaxID=63121 RepID=UPI00396A3E36
MDNKGWNDIGYSFLIGQDGNAYEGRGWAVEGAHTAGYNDESHAVSFMGNFMDALPNQSALDAAQALIDCGIAEGYISSDYTLKGHRDVGSTSCPGDALYDEIQTWDHYPT